MTEAEAEAERGRIVAAGDCERLFVIERGPDGRYFAVRDSHPRFVFTGPDIPYVATLAASALAHAARLGDGASG